jgi:hypothetical protein
MRRRCFIDRKEVEIRVRRAHGREHSATPWWKLAGERVGRVQRASTRRGGAGIGLAASFTREEAWSRRHTRATTDPVVGPLTRGT